MKPFSEKSWHFSPPSKSSILGSVTHYNETILWEILAFLPTVKLFSVWVGYPLQWNHSLRNPGIFHHLQNLSFLGRLPITVKPFSMKPFWEILAFLTPSKLFHPGRSPITTRPLWKISTFFKHFEKSPHFSPLRKIFMFFTTLRNLHISHNFENFCIFEKIFVFFQNLSPVQVAHHHKIILKNLCIFHHFEKSSHFSPLWKFLCFWKIFVFFITCHLGRSPITTRPLWKKNLCIFSPFLRKFRISHHFEKSLYFSTLWKIFAFFTTLRNLRISHHLEKSLHFSPLRKNLSIFQNLSSGQVAHYNKTTLKNLCIFHPFKNALHFSPGQVAHYNKITFKFLFFFIFFG